MELSFKQGKRVQLSQAVMKEITDTLQAALKPRLSISSVHFCPSLLSNTLYDVHVDILAEDLKAVAGSVFYLVRDPGGPLRLDLTAAGLLYPFFDFSKKVTS